VNTSPTGRLHCGSLAVATQFGGRVMRSLTLTGSKFCDRSDVRQGPPVRQIHISACDVFVIFTLRTVQDGWGSLRKRWLLVWCAFPVLRRGALGFGRVALVKRTTPGLLNISCPRGWICISRYRARVPPTGIRVIRESTEKLGILRLPQKAPDLRDSLISLFTWLQAPQPSTWRPCKRNEGEPWGGGELDSTGGDCGVGAEYFPFLSSSVRLVYIRHGWRVYLDSNWICGTIRMVAYSYQVTPESARRPDRLPSTIVSPSLSGPLPNSS